MESGLERSDRFWPTLERKLLIIRAQQLPLAPDPNPQLLSESSGRCLGPKVSVSASGRFWRLLAAFPGGFGGFLAAFPGFLAAFWRDVDMPDQHRHEVVVTLSRYSFEAVLGDASH